MSEKRYLDKEWQPDNHPDPCCEEDGCVVHFMPDASTRSRWCKHADGETLHVHEGWYWVHCDALLGYVRICRVDA